MTVKELIEQLGKCDKNSQVLAECDFGDDQQYLGSPTEAGEREYKDGTYTVISVYD
jgi:hypothetical protein